MIVTSAEIIRRQGTLPKEAWNARAVWREREGVVLRLRDDQGRIGLGEAAPLPGFSPDTLDRCEDTLRAFDMAGVPERRTGDDVIPWLEVAGRLVDPNAPAARFAIETALLDLAARAEEKRLHELIGGEVQGERFGRERAIPLAALIGGHEKEEIVGEIRRAIERGIGTIKMKIGAAGRFDEELALLRAVRDEFGGAIALRLDANGAWDLAEGEARLAALAPFDPEFVEQPIVPDLLLKLGDSPVTVAADETLALPGAAERLNLTPPCRVFVLKPMVLGGFIRALQLAEIARARKYGIVVSHLFDGPVALAAAAELALALRPEPIACGLDRHAGLALWPEMNAPQVTDVEIHPAPGLGLGVESPKGLS